MEGLVQCMKENRKKSKNTTKIYVKASLYLMLGIIAIFYLTRGAKAKYLTEVPFSGNVKIDAGLAQEFHLYEHKAVVDERETINENGTTAYVSDGIYKLKDGSDGEAAETVETNTYTGVLPDSDLKKDPFITIKNKTDMKAYLYVEVVESGFPSGDKIVYSLRNEGDTKWMKVTYTDTETGSEKDALGNHGGKLYVYYGDGSSAKKLDSSLTKDEPGKTKTIDLLANDQVTVSPTINNADAQSGFGLDFYGYMAEISDSDDPYAVFNEAFGTP